MPGQNTPAYTTKETVEQGMKLFTAIYKRVYRAQTKELKKIYELNKYYLDEQEYVSILDEPVQASDYQAPPDDLMPAADPSASSNTEKLSKAEALMQLLPLGTINPMGVTMRWLDALDETNPQDLIIPPEQQQPQPDPKVEAMKAQSQIKMQESQAKMQMDQVKAALEQQEKTMNMKFEQQKMEMQLQYDAIKQQLDIEKAKQDVQAAQMNHQQKMVHTHEKHQQQLQHQKQKPNSSKEK